MADASQGKLYYLQITSMPYSGNSPLFWRKGGSGYTQWIDEAERFEEKRAENIIRGSKGSHTWKLWTVEQVELVAKRTVDMQDLNRL